MNRDNFFNFNYQEFDESVKEVSEYSVGFLKKMEPEIENVDYAIRTIDDNLQKNSNEQMGIETFKDLARLSRNSTKCGNRKTSILSKCVPFLRYLRDKNKYLIKLDSIFKTKNNCFEESAKKCSSFPYKHHCLAEMVSLKPEKRYMCSSST